MSGALPLAGGLAGGAIGGPLGSAIGSELGGIVEGLMNQKSIGRLSDLRISGSAYGASIPRIWGINKVAGNIIWVANYGNTTDNKLVPSTSYVLLTVNTGGAIGATSITVFSNVVSTTIPELDYFTNAGHAVELTAPATVDAFGNATLSIRPLAKAVNPGEVFSTTKAVIQLLYNAHTSVNIGLGSGGITDGLQQKTWYSVSVFVAFCEGTLFTSDGSFINRNPVIKRIWGNDLLIYDVDNPPGNRVTMRFYYGDETQSPDTLCATAEAAGNSSLVPAYRGLCGVLIEGLNLTAWASTVPSFNAEIWTDAVTTGDIASDLMQQLNLDSSDINVTAATTNVTGFIAQERDTGQNHLGNILSYYATDIADFNGQLNIIPRGNAAILAIADTDLGAVSEATRSDSAIITTLTRVRGVRAELPGRVDLTYSDFGKGFAQTTQTDIKQTAFFQNVSAINVPLTLYSTDARQMAARINDTTWLEADTFIFTLPYRYIWLTPTDVVTLEDLDDGNTYNLRIIKMVQNDPGEITFTCVQDDPNVLTQGIQGDGGTGVSSNSGQTEYPVNFGAWSGFALQQADYEVAGFYVWGDWPNGGNGGTVYYSPDGGTTLIEGPVITQRTPFGTATSSLPASTPTQVWDTTDSFTVNLENDGGALSLGSTTQADVEGGSNIALVGTEVLGFATVAQIDDQDYTLSTLYRHLIGSSSPGVSSGDLFVILTPAVTYVPVPSAYVGDSVEVAILAPGQVWSDVTPVSVTVAVPTLTANTIAINNLNTSMTTVEGEITTINTTFSSDGSSISTLNTEVGALQTLVESPVSINKVFAGPSSGSSADPVFRILTPADLPLATTGQEGIIPALSGVATQFLDGSGAWATPGGGSGYTYPPSTKPASTTAINTQSEFTSGLLLSYQLNEGTGSSTADQGNAGLNITFPGGSANPTWDTSPNYLTFSGSEYLSVAQTGVADVAQYMIVARFRPTWTGGSLSYNPCLCAMRDGTSTRWSIHIGNVGGDYTHIGVYNGTIYSYNVISSGIVVQNSWCFLILQVGAGDPIYQGNNDGYPLWINGNYMFPTWTNGGSPSIGTATHKPFMIGASTPGPTEEWIGDIDFINVYDRPLGANEVAAYNKYLYRLWGV